MRTVLSDNLSWQTDTCNVYLCEEGLAIRVDCESDCVYVYRTTKSRGLMQIVFIDRLEIGIKHIVELQYLSPLLTMLNFFYLASGSLNIPRNQSFMCSLLSVV